MAFTYYVSTSGSDLATGLTELLAFQHIDKAMNVVAAGDKVYVKADGDYAEFATIDTVGTTTAPIVFEGYTATPGDGGQATMTGGAVRTRCLSYSLGTGTDTFYVFKNFRFTNATEVAVFLALDYLTFKNCKFDTSPTGCAARIVVCEECEFSSCSTAGVDPAGDGASIYVGCIFYNNGDGLIGEKNGGVVVFGCTFFSNSGANLKIGASTYLGAVINCTFDGDAKDSNSGVSISATDIIIAVVNTVLYDCTVGMTSPGGDMGERAISRNNCVNGNTTPYINAATFTGEVTSAPQFTNEVGGADYTPAPGSPLINAGLNG